MIIGTILENVPEKRLIFWNVPVMSKASLQNKLSSLQNIYNNHLT